MNRRPDFVHEFRPGPLVRAVRNQLVVNLQQMQEATVAALHQLSAEAEGPIDLDGIGRQLALICKANVGAAACVDTLNTFLAKASK